MVRFIEVRRPHGHDLVSAALTIVHEVVRGDILSAVDCDAGQGNRAADLLAADRAVFTDPDLIHPGQVLRAPFC